MKKYRLILISVVLAFLLVLIFFLFSNFSFWSRVELIFHDIRVNYFLESPETMNLSHGETKLVRVDDSIQSKIVFVDIDEKSLNEIGKWPWDRNIYAEFISQIEKFNPSLVLLDLYFPEKSEHDEELAETINKYNNIGCVYNFTTQRYLSPDQKTLDNIKNWAIKTDMDDSIGEIKSILPTVSPISDNSFLGHDLLLRDIDDIYRKIPVYVIYDGYIYPSISAIMYMKYKGYKLNDIELNEDTFSLRDRDIPIDEIGQTFVDYYIAPETRNSFRHISFVDMLNGRVQMNLKDKIVLIGITAKGIGSAAQDRVLTPVGEIYGIEYIANSMLNIFQNRFVKEIPLFYENLAFLFFAILLGFIDSMLGGWKNLIITLFAVILVIVLSFWLYNIGYYNNLAKFIIGAFIIYLVLTFYKYLIEQKEKANIRNMFSSYVSENIVSELINNPAMAKLQGHKRDMSVLFSDIVGFTGYTEKHNPINVVERLNEYLDEMTDVIIKNGGTLDKFVGDEILVLFGAPLKQGNHADLATKTAIDMRIKIEKLKSKWMAQSKEILEMGIGINSGEMLVGNIGSEGRKMDYTVIGDNVNLGARIEGLTRHYGIKILASEATYKKSVNYKEHFRFVDRVRVVGKRNPTKIYQIDIDPVNELIKDYSEKAYQFYRSKKWDEAEYFYSKILEEDPRDRVAKLFLDKINYYRNNPPSPDWDGVYNLDKK
ncbi:MAG TPA: adenylate/guanylate cyclase domain-containing protein [Candidatus Mcinerneyibacterium sp.]|nr:adenylate/guanylate cyclase domain-containing protein [Candidatus Mcinerneyibacterium sp.]